MQNTPCPITWPTSPEPCRSFYTTSCAPYHLPIWPAPAPPCYPGHLPAHQGNHDQQNHLPDYLVHHLQASPTQHLSANQSLDSFITSANYQSHHLPVQYGHILPVQQGLGSFFLLKPSCLRWLWITTTTTSVWETDFFIDLLWVLIHRFSWLLDLSQISLDDSLN